MVSTCWEKYINMICPNIQLPSNKIYITNIPGMLFKYMYLCFFIHLLYLTNNCSNTFYNGQLVFVDQQESNKRIQIILEIKLAETRTCFNADCIFKGHSTLSHVSVTEIALDNDTPIIYIYIYISLNTFQLCLKHLHVQQLSFNKSVGKITKLIFQMFFKTSLKLLHAKNKVLVDICNCGIF